MVTMFPRLKKGRDITVITTLWMVAFMYKTELDLKLFLPKNNELHKTLVDDR